MDTRYFDHEFTEESICVTPPGKSTSQTNKQTNKRTISRLLFLDSIESLDKLSLPDDAFERYVLPTTWFPFSLLNLHVYRLVLLILAMKH